MASAFAAAGPLPPPANRQVDYLTDIQPIFAAKCAKCHGPDKQKGGYRLDNKEAALNGGDEHAPNIRPGNSAESPLIQFISGIPSDMQMPNKGESLTAGQIGLLRAWIDQGAVWPSGLGGLPKKDPLDWWSLKPIKKALPPPGSGLNPIDAFIGAKLSANGLAPSPQADPRTLARRIYFDLTGLPPSQAEVDAFLSESAQEAEAAIGRLADKLLASPRYGERWARHWLDVVHYGDTHGYDKDKPRPNAWPYRDYVIRALNEDKPYGRFVQEQIAGDALFPNTEDGMVALGFISAGPWDFIGHAELPESKTDGKIARLLDRDDMVANTMNSFCAMTVQCARCHNHKFDPVRQEDYYRLQAVFSALDRADKSFDTDPLTAQRRAALELRTSALEQQKKELEANRAPGNGKLALLDKLLGELRRPKETAARPEFGYHSAIEARQDAIKWVQVDLGQPRAISKILYAGCHDDFNQIGAGFGFPLRFKVEISNDSKFSDGVTILEDQTQSDLPNPGVAARSIELHDKTARYIRFTATKLAPRMNDYILALAELQALDIDGRNLALAATVASLDSIEASPRWSRANLVDGYYYAQSASVSRIAQLEKERGELAERSLTDPAAVYLAKIEEELATSKSELQKLPPPKVVYSGTVYNGTGAFAGTGASGGKPRPIFVLKRGDVGQPGEEVGPGTVPLGAQLASKFELAEPESTRRTALANWITNKENPLTWRVIVNRVWQYHFGRGLVDSPNDFGRMGQMPTHPELLDWLAAEFRDGGQSLKSLHRLIVTSATYRQSSAGNPDAEKLDANNTLLWRMNRRKLEAEAMHDSLLLVAGKLDLTMGGPGYQDFVVEKAEHSPHYEYGLHDVEDPKAFRRSIYRFIVRSQPQPFMTVLDCADPSMLVEKRNETVNALQALALRNNKLTIAMAAHFAERIALISEEPQAQIAAAFHLAFDREPRPDESEVLVPFVKQHGLANACRVILNLNEFAFID